MKKAEEQLQLSVCKYIKLQYPDVLFMSDFSAGLRLPIWLATKRKKMNSCKGMPDLCIFAKRKGYSGLAIELKSEGIKLYKKDNNTWISKHIAEQANILRRLKSEGWYAVFCVGLDEAIHTVEHYMEN